MRTKTLLLSAVALAAGLVSSVAQSNVYSANIVGYVNRVFPTGINTFVSNPLSNGTNDLDSVLGAAPAKSTAAFWTGTTFTNSTKGATAWSPNFAIPPGVGFFVSSKSAFTNTFSGQVAVTVGGSTTNSLPAGVTVAVGSTIPYSGDLNSTNIGLLVVPAKSTAAFWTGTGYTNSTKGATAWSPVIPIGVSDGFFISSKTATNWVQNLSGN